MITVNVTRNDFAKVGRQMLADTVELVDEVAREVADDANSRNPMSGKFEVDRKGPGHAVVQIAKTYWHGAQAHFIEWGTVFRGARPMLTPAIESRRGTFARRLARIFD